ncbi:hypothetical protein VSR68_11060 [Paraburkholderia phymatum]|uniref:hypothetical protein n=1 Tax=Paraburkholderia phymatum TaxID=148447 RepID=UPI003173AF5A
MIKKTFIVVVFGSIFSAAYAQQSVLTCAIDKSDTGIFKAGKEYDIPIGNMQQRGSQYFMKGVNGEAKAYISIDRETGEFKYSDGAYNFLTKEQDRTATGMCHLKKIKF